MKGQVKADATVLTPHRVWRNTYWTGPHRAWVAAQSFGEPALVTALAHYRATLDSRETELACIESELAPWARRDPLDHAVARLCCYRGIAGLTALTLAAEVAGWRRFPAARAFMGYTGLVPCEYSGGERTWRGHITKAGSGPVRTALTEAAWACRFAPAVGVTLRRRQEGAAPETIARSWKAQRRLHGKYRRMVTGGKASPEAITAVARELAGFVWAEMTS